MIDFYYWPTPNGWKVSIMLEETGLPYTLKPVNIGAGDQFKPEFLAISPNARMPAIVDHDTPDGPTAGVRIRRHPDPSGGEIRPVHAGFGKGPEGMPGMAVLAGRQPRPDGRASSVTSSTTRKACRRAIISMPTSATPANTIAAWACWSGGWRGGTTSWTNTRSPT